MEIFECIARLCVFMSLYARESKILIFYNGVSMKKYIKNTILMFVSTVFALVISEFGFRYYKYVYADHNTGGVVVNTYFKAPHSKGKWYEFSEDLKFEFQNDVAFNNWGFRFHEDYSAQKSDSEFRIAVLGDSYTENETNDFTWVTPFSVALNSNTELKKVLGVSKITVANFARSGSGVIHMSRELTRVGKLFKPDLVIFAFIDEDFNRITNSKATKVNSFETESALIKNNKFKCASEEVPGAPGFYACTGSNWVSRAFYYDGGDEKEIMNEANLKKLKDYMKYHVFMKASESIIWREVKKYARKIEVNNYHNLYFSKFEEALENAQKIQKEVLFLNLPAFYEIVNQSSEKAPPKPFTYWPHFFRKRPDVPLISLIDHLPKNASYKERYSWFSLPYDGHPSNKGALLYGEISADMIAKYIIAKSNRKTPDVLVTKAEIKSELARTRSAGLEHTEQAMAFLKKARSFNERGNYQAAYQNFSRVIELKTMIGQPGLVYFERAQVAAKLKQYKKALEDLNSAIAVNSHESFYKSRINVAAELKEYQLIAQDIEVLKKEFSDKPDIKKFIEKAQKTYNKNITASIK